MEWAENARQSQLQAPQTNTEGAGGTGPLLFLLSSSATERPAIPRAIWLRQKDTETILYLHTVSYEPFPLPMKLIAPYYF